METLNFSALLWAAQRSDAAVMPPGVVYESPPATGGVCA